MKLITNIDNLVTVNADGKKFKAGKDMQDIGLIENGAMLFDEKIIWTGTAAEASKKVSKGEFSPDETIDAAGKTILPGFVDPHTHIVFGGNRTHEFARRLRGVSYVEIAKEGGGILTTVEGTRNASVEELAETGRKLAWSAMKHGTTAIEVKSGYGLNMSAEIKQLEAIKKLKEELPIHVSATFLGAHDFPPEYKSDREKYIDILCKEMIPAVAEKGLAEYCDAFIDEGYYTLEEGEKVLRAGLDNRMKLKVHCDELADFGSTVLASGMGAISADHLLFVSDEGINSMRDAGTVATLLPGTAYFIRMPYAPARKIIEKGAITALSTDCNPGSSFTENMQLIMSLAAINMHMTAEECISAATINAAAAIEQSHKMGSIEPGKQADFIIADIPSYSDLFYHFGINHVGQVWVRGKKIINNQKVIHAV